jgi:hypothetical protein
MGFGGAVCDYGETDRLKIGMAGLPEKTVLAGESSPKQGG